MNCGCLVVSGWKLERFAARGMGGVDRRCGMGMVVDVMGKR